MVDLLRDAHRIVLNSVSHEPQLPIVAAAHSPQLLLIYNVSTRATVDEKDTLPTASYARKKPFRIVSEQNLMKPTPIDISYLSSLSWSGYNNDVPM
jgi:hypothetical protein